MNQGSVKKNSLIAPCGMNCAICLGYLREKNRCEGCRTDSLKKPNQCLNCIIINCELLKKSESGFCFDCEKFPCPRLRRLDKRYRTKYNMSMLENLASIKDIGLESFTVKENIRWKCQSCGGTICVHRGVCLSCNAN